MDEKVDLDSIRAHAMDEAEMQLLELPPCPEPKPGHMLGYNTTTRQWEHRPMADIPEPVLRRARQELVNQLTHAMEVVDAIGKPLLDINAELKRRGVKLDS